MKWYPLAQTRSSEVRRDSLNKFRPVLGGELVMFKCG